MWARTPNISLVKALAVAAGLCGLVAPLTAQAQRLGVTTRQPAALSASDAARFLRVIADEAVTPAERRSAAQALLGVTDPAQRAQVLELLAPSAPTDPRRELLDATGAAGVPDWMMQSLTGLMGALNDEDRARLLRGLGSTRTRDAAALLVKELCAASTSASRDALIQALVRLSGRRDLSPTCETWTRWLNEALALPETEWARRLAEAHARRSDQTAAQLDRVTTRLREMVRRSYIDLADAAQRTRLIDELLTDDIVDMRRLGVELINRELANARPLEASTMPLVIALLSDPSPDLRAAAADIVYVQVPPSAARPLTEALSRETDPIAAASLLKASSRWPRGSIVGVVLDWLERSEPSSLVTRRPAIDAALALLSDGLIDSEARARLVRALGRFTPSDMGVAGLTILARAGEDNDRAMIAGLLTDGGAVRTAAADALAATPLGVDALLQAAERDPALFTSAALAASRWRPTLASYVQLRAVKPPSPEAQREALSLIGASLSGDDVLAATSDDPDDALREAVLTRWVRGHAPSGTPAQPQSTETLPKDPAFERVVLLLAWVRMNLGQSSGALEALNLLGPVPEPPDGGERRALATTCLLWLNRVDEAASLNADPDAWLDGLARSVDLAHGPALVQTIRDRFKGNLSQEQLALLTKLETRIADR